MSENRSKDTSELLGEPVIQISGMNKWFGQFHVLRDIDLTVYRGERIVICGPSGSGSRRLSVVSIVWRSINKAPSLSTILS